MILATTIITIAQPRDDGPDLHAALVSSDAAGAARPTATTPTTPPATTAPPMVADIAADARAKATTKKPAPRATTSGGTAPVATAGNGTQAATLKGWKATGGDEFNGGLSSTWGKYDGEGHGGNGRRAASAVTVEGGSLVIRGDANGTTGGLAWNSGQRYGKWEMRAKFPAGDSQYHPVLILWPTDIEWPRGGEIDFAETESGAKDVSFFLHYGSSNNQKSAKKAIDITQWHNYAVEWTASGVTGYIDGQAWFTSTDSGTLPPGKMHPTIQLDYFPDGGAPKPTALYVDWMRIYQ
jgi:hypothetical protein